MQTHSIDTAFEFDAPAETVWEILEDFGNIERWWPANSTIFPLDRVELEGSGIGMIRKFYVGGSNKPTCERLDYLDPVQRVLKLSIIGDAPAGLTWYQAAGHVVSLSAHRCRFTYCGEYTTAAENPEDTRRFLQAAYQFLGSGIEQALAKTRFGASGYSG